MLDPFEQIDSGVRHSHADVSAQLLKRLRAADPDFLEQSVLDTLQAIGYGGVGQRQRARRIGGSGDGGVDGVIDQDALGLSRIYVQAKRYAADNVVGRPQIQGFVWALHGQQATPQHPLESPRGRRVSQSGELAHPATTRPRQGVGVGGGRSGGGGREVQRAGHRRQSRRTGHGPCGGSGHTWARSGNE